MYVVNPGFFFRMMIGIAKMFVSQDLIAKVSHLSFKPSKFRMLIEPEKKNSDPIRDIATIASIH